MREQLCIICSKATLQKTKYDHTNSKNPWKLGQEFKNEYLHCKFLWAKLNLFIYTMACAQMMLTVTSNELKISFPGVGFV